MSSGMRSAQAQAVGSVPCGRAGGSDPPFSHRGCFHLSLSLPLGNQQQQQKDGSPPARGWSAGQCCDGVRLVGASSRTPLHTDVSLPPSSPSEKEKAKITNPRVRIKNQLQSVPPSLWASKLLGSLFNHLDVGERDTSCFSAKTPSPLLNLSGHFVCSFRFPNTRPARRLLLPLSSAGASARGRSCAPSRCGQGGLTPNSAWLLHVPPPGTRPHRALSLVPAAVLGSPFRWQRICISFRGHGPSAWGPPG